MVPLELTRRLVCPVTEGREQLRKARGHHPLLRGGQLRDAPPVMAGDLRALPVFLEAVIHLAGGRAPEEIIIAEYAPATFMVPVEVGIALGMAHIAQLLGGGPQPGLLAQLPARRVGEL